MKRLNRRDFLKLAGLTGVSLAAFACSDSPSTPTRADTPAPTPTATPTSIVIEVTAPPRTTPSATPPPKTPRTLRQWDTWSDQQAAWFEAEMALFEAAYPWLRIERARQEDMPTALQSGAPPDVYFGGPLPIQQYHQKKWLCAAISDFADFDDFRAIFPDPAIDFAPGSNVIDGKTYTAPRQGRNGLPVVTYVNRNVTEAYGLASLPEDDEAFLEACRKIALDSGNSAYGYALGFATGWMNDLFEWLGALSFKVGGRDWRTPASQYARNPAFLGLLKLLSTLTYEGLILPESYLADEWELRRLFAEGRVAMLAGPLRFVDDWQQSHPDFTQYTVLPPLRVGGPQRFASYAPPGITGTPLYIHAQSQLAEEAWLWFKWLHLPECGRRWAAAGLGTSIFPANNQPGFLPLPVLEDYAALNAALTRVEPLPESGNLACYQVQPQPVAAPFASLVARVYDYWLPSDDIAPALEQLAADSDAAWQTALTAAQKAGAAVSEEDFVFEDWNPLEDYSPHHVIG
jgi:multiple sugar transport system substrate-binding protein